MCTVSETVVHNSYVTFIFLYVFSQKTAFSQP